ncbi:GDYXXLXY domain-containing protein [Calidifontibacillus oryziterrae]|uniref:GDYXXLXY domain-containing protein n=1 Tax=Calidifontibacillus oryziterrae TaxID=1191699 RepID=UPI0002DAB000|nr:GDYXXLXY domain-containing protein [Calidifontibacillus oryziterrae]
MEYGKKQEWKVKGIQISYIFGLSLIITAIIYFFAANWPGFDKWMKIGLSVSLIVFFYIISFVLGKLVKKHPFLSDLFLFLGCLSFGVGVALLGQIYNSHADSYMLFMIWSIPALLFSIFTKYQPFYILSYGLLHFTLWFYLFPSSGFQYVPKEFAQWILLITALVNGILYLVTDRGILKSRPLQYCSFIMMQIILLGLTMEELFDWFNVFVSSLFILLSIALYIYILKKQFNKPFLVLVGLFSIAFIIIKFIEFIDYIGSEYVFLFTIFIPFVIVGFVIFGLRKWRQNQRGEQQSFLKKIIVGVATAVASIIAGSSILGISYLFFDDVSFTFFLFFAIALIIIGVLMEKWDQVIRYTLLFTAFFLGVPATFLESSSWLGLLFIGALVFVFWSIQSSGFRYVTYLVTMISFFAVINDINYDIELVFGLILTINLAIYFGTTKVIDDGRLKDVLINNSIFYGMFSFFFLTFLFENEPILYYFTNGSYFVLTTLYVLLTLKQNHKVHHWILLLFWFAFIVYKYYDLVWGLLHKSVTFLITGLIIIAITIKFDNIQLEGSGRKPRTMAMVTAIVTIIAVQIVTLGVQIQKSEHLLTNGELIKLELAPIDPRSLLQGDYLVLRYDISSLELDEDVSWNERIFVGLEEKTGGVYEYSGVYATGKAVPDDIKNRADVWITGKFKGYENIEYGIENYFVPEGTGWDLQEIINYAYVRVAENGDALLVDVARD